MAKTFKALSALLSYPTEELQGAAPMLAAVLAEEGLIPGASLKSINRVIDEIAKGDLFDLQERYALLFDRTRSLSLHLFEHVHGESRDRGQAMIDLAQLYNRHGLALMAKELPDYLPLFLEFLSTLQLREAGGLLAETMHILAALEHRLRKRQSSYASVFRALQDIAKAPPESDALSKADDEDDDPDDLEALDRAWAEEPVSFGPSWASGCSSDRVAARIRAALRPADGSSKLPQH